MTWIHFFRKSFRRALFVGEGRFLQPEFKRQFEISPTKITTNWIFLLSIRQSSRKRPSTLISIYFSSWPRLAERRFQTRQCRFHLLHRLLRRIILEADNQSLEMHFHLLHRRRQHQLRVVLIRSHNSNLPGGHRLLRLHHSVEFGHHRRQLRAVRIRCLHPPSVAHRRLPALQPCNNPNIHSPNNRPIM